MFVVLVKRVLEFLGVLEDLVSPVPWPNVTKDTASHVLSFHYKHAISGDDSLINLSGSVLRGHGDVLDEIETAFI